MLKSIKVHNNIIHNIDVYLTLHLKHFSKMLLIVLGQFLKTHLGNY